MRKCSFGQALYWFEARMRPGAVASTDEETPASMWCQTESRLSFQELKHGNRADLAISSIPLDKMQSVFDELHCTHLMEDATLDSLLLRQFSQGS